MWQNRLVSNDDDNNIITGHATFFYNGWLSHGTIVSRKLLKLQR